MFWERKLWQRLIDDQLIAKSTTKQAIETLETLLKLVCGVRKLPARGSDGNERERTIRLRNPIVKRTIVDVPGAYDLLVQCGFKRTVIEMEERLTFPVPLSEAAVRTAESRLSTSVSIFSSSLEKLRQRSDLETLSKQAAKEDNERRMKVVLEKIKDDRKRHKEREARRKEPSKKNGDSSLSDMKPVPGSRDWM
ncbi:hypothetical protein JCM3766R1_003730 [Sporobolomyces carnicolor]